MSPRAAWRLEGLGFKSVHEYSAGVADWAAAGTSCRRGPFAEVPTIGEISRKDVPVAEPQERVGEVKAHAEADGWDTAIVINDQK